MQFSNGESVRSKYFEILLLLLMMIRVQIQNHYPLDFLYENDEPFQHSNENEDGFELLEGSEERRDQCKLKYWGEVSLIQEGEGKEEGK